MKRHNIERYDDLNADPFAGWMMVFGIIAFFAIFVGLPLALIPPQTPWVIGLSVAAMLPAAIHGALACTHINRGLNYNQSAVMQVYCKLPKHLKDDIKLTRDEVLTLNSKECDNVRTKMETTLQHFNRDYTGPVGRVNTVLDSHIETYRALESME